MNVIKTTSPYIRKNINTSRMMIDVIVALTPITLFSLYRFGWDAFIRIFISIFVMVLLEAIAFGMLSKGLKAKNFKQTLKNKYEKYTINNVIIPALSGLIFALIIPSKLPIYSVIVGATFAIVVGKMIFGGTGNNIFNVAALGRIFIGVTLSGQFVNTYEGVDFVAGSTALSAVKGSIGFDNIFNHYTLQQLFIGNIPGSMGEISAILILLGGIYLIIRRSADFRLILGSLIPFSILMLLAGFIQFGSEAFNFMLFQLFSGGILFGAVFMITDPVTAPLTKTGRLLYALLFSIITVCIRLFGAYPEGVAFAILISNVFVSLLDYPGFLSEKIHTKFLILYSSVFIISVLVIWYGWVGL